MNETDERSGGNKASLTDTSTLTLDRLEDISQLLFFFLSFHFRSEAEDSRCNF